MLLAEKLIGPSASGAGDPYWDNVVLLLHGDGTDGSTTFVDSSPSPKSFTATGNARISTAQSKFGGSSMYFDGTGDYISAAANADFGFGTGDFTVEFWAYFSTVSGINPGNVCHGVSNGSFCAYIVQTQIQLARYNSGGDLTASVTQTTNSWVHFAITRSSGTARVFKDGVQRASGTVSTNYGQNGFQIGLGGSSAVNGYIDELRITKGVARYTANFTPPTEAFPNF